MVPPSPCCAPCCWLSKWRMNICCMFCCQGLAPGDGAGERGLRIGRDGAEPVEGGHARDIRKQARPEHARDLPSPAKCGLTTGHRILRKTCKQALKADKNRPKAPSHFRSPSGCRTAGRLYTSGAISPLRAPPSPVVSLESSISNAAEFARWWPSVTTWLCAKRSA